MFEALRVGASGFLVKDTEPVELLQASGWWRAATRSCPPASPGGWSPSSRPAAGSRTASRLDVLTEREKEIVALVGEGLSNDEIADAPRAQPGDREDPRQPRHDQTRRPRPRPARRGRLPDRPGPPRLARLTSTTPSGSTPAHADCARVAAQVTPPRDDVAATARRGSRCQSDPRHHKENRHVSALLATSRRSCSPTTGTDPGAWWPIFPIMWLAVRRPSRRHRRFVAGGRRNRVAAPRARAPARPSSPSASPPARSTRQEYRARLGVLRSRSTRMTADDRRDRRRGHAA